MASMIEIKIAGRSYRLNTDEDADHMQDLADQVTIEMRRFGEDPNVSALDAAIMTALLFADKLHKSCHVPKSRAKSSPKPKNLS